MSDLTTEGAARATWSAAPAPSSSSVRPSTDSRRERHRGLGKSMTCMLRWRSRRQPLVALCPPTAGNLYRGHGFRTRRSPDAPPDRLQDDEQLASCPWQAPRRRPAVSASGPPPLIDHGRPPGHRGVSAMPVSQSIMLETVSSGKALRSALRGRALSARLPPRDRSRGSLFAELRIVVLLHVLGDARVRSGASLRPLCQQPSGILVARPISRGRAGSTRTARARRDGSRIDGTGVFWPLIVKSPRRA